MPSRSDAAAQARTRRRQGLAIRVRELRTAQGWTQEELAHQTGFDRKSINRIETAAYSPVTDRIFELADALGVTASDLLTGIE